MRIHAMNIWNSLIVVDADGCFSPFPHPDITKITEVNQALFCTIRMVRIIEEWIPLLAIALKGDKNHIILWTLPLWWLGFRMLKFGTRRKKTWNLWQSIFRHIPCLDLLEKILDTKPRITGAHENTISAAYRFGAQKLTFAHINFNLNWTYRALAHLDCRTSNLNLFGRGRTWSDTRRTKRPQTELSNICFFCIFGKFFP